MNVLNDLTLRICLVYISSGNEFIEATLLFSKGVLWKVRISRSFLPKLTR